MFQVGKLRPHLMAHHQDYMFKCNLECQFKCLSLKVLLQHLETSHGKTAIRPVELPRFAGLPLVIGRVTCTICCPDLGGWSPWMSSDKSGAVPLGEPGIWLTDTYSQ